MLFKNRKIKLKKIISVSATALALAGFGEVTINHVNHIPIASQTVKAVTITPADVTYDDATMSYSLKTGIAEQELIDNGQSHTRNWHLHGRNSIRVHWYHHPQLRNEFPNVDFDGAHVDYERNLSQLGYAWIVGTIRINGRTMYMSALNSSEVFLDDTANINHSPRLYQANHITLYADGDSAIRDGSGSLAIMVPYNHKASILPDGDTGKLGKYVPVLATTDNVVTSAFVVTASDYNRIIRQRQPRTVYMYYQGHVISAGHHGKGHINISRLKHGREYRKERSGAYALTKGRHHKALQRKALKKLRNNIIYHVKHGDNSFDAW